MTTYLSPIGYDSTRVTRPILSRGLDAGDHVILLLPKTAEDDQRSSEAIEDVQRLLREIEPAVSLSKEFITHVDLQEAVFVCSDVIRSIDDELIANFGGGARDIYLAFTVAVLNHLDSFTAIIRFSDIDGRVAQTELPDLTIQVPETGAAILEALAAADGSSMLPEITEVVSRSKSTITRHVSDLEDQRAVRTEMHGKTKYVELTFTGALYVKARR